MTDSDSPTIAPLHVSTMAALLRPDEIMLSFGRIGVTMTEDGNIATPPTVDWCVALTISPVLLMQMAEIFARLKTQYEGNFNAIPQINPPVIN